MQLPDKLHLGKGNVSLDTLDSLEYEFLKDLLFGENISPSDIFGNDSQYYDYNYTDWSVPPLDLKGRARAFLGYPVAIITLVLIFISTLTNISLIIATRYCPGGVTTHKKLIISLALSDTCTCISVLMHEMNKLFNASLMLYEVDPDERLLSSCIFSCIHAFNVMSHLITLLNLSAMALDHYIAIMYPLSYSRIMRKRNGIILICAMWVLSVFGGFSNFFIGINRKELPSLNFCEYIMFASVFQSDYIVYCLVPIIVIFITYIYMRVYCVVRRLNRTAPRLSRSLNNTMKASLTTLIIIASFAVCYLTKILYEFVLVVKALTDHHWLAENASALTTITRYLYALTLLNCFLDPVIYALRLGDIQQGYRTAFCHCCSRWWRQQTTSYFADRHSTRRSTVTSHQLPNDFRQDDRYDLEHGTPLIDQNGDSARGQNGSIPNGHGPTSGSPKDNRQKSDSSEMNGGSRELSQLNGSALFHDNYTSIERNNTIDHHCDSATP